MLPLSHRITQNLVLVLGVNYSLSHALAADIFLWSALFQWCGPHQLLCHSSSHNNTSMCFQPSLVMTDVAKRVEVYEPLQSSLFIVNFYWIMKQLKLPL